MASLNVGEAIGVVLVATGFVALFSRSFAGALQLNDLFLTGIGALAVVLGINYFRDGRSEPRRSTPVDDVEPRYEVPVPGDETDRTLGAVGGLSPESVRNQREFHDTLTEVAIETLEARGDYATSDAARAAIADGTWTDDEVAAWFLGDEVTTPLSVRLRTWVGSDGEFAFAAKRTIAALAVARGLDAELPEADDLPLAARLLRVVRGETDEEETPSDAADASDTAGASGAAGATDGRTVVGSGDDTGGGPGDDADGTVGGGPGAALGGGRARGSGGTASRVTDHTGDATGSEASEWWRLTEERE